MKRLLFVILIFNATNSFAQLNQTEYNTATFHDQPNPKLNVSMYYYKVAHGLGQAYWITIQNLTGKHISVTGEYFANLKCGNQSRAKFEIDIKAYETAVPASGALVDATGLQASTGRDLCDIPATYENGKTVWHNMINEVGFQIFNVKDLDADDSQSSNNGQQNGNNNQRQNNQVNQGYQQDQQRQQQENQQRQQEAQRLRQQNIERINQANERMGEVNQNAFGALGDIADMILQNSFRNSIQRENQQRQKGFDELKENARTKSGQIENCNQCSGQGYTTCGSCSGAGKKSCMGCFGKGTTNCTLCYGTGTFNNNICGSCGGKGSFQCAICKGTGNSYCTDCHATGKQFCTYCNGTGQEFKEADHSSSQASNQFQSGQRASVANQGRPIRVSSAAEIKRKEINDDINKIDGQIYKQKKSRGVGFFILGGLCIGGAVAAEVNEGAVGSSPSDPLYFAIPGVIFITCGIVKSSKSGKKIKKLYQEKKQLRIDLNAISAN